MLLLAFLAAGCGRVVAGRCQFSLPAGGRPSLVSTGDSNIPKPEPPKEPVRMSGRTIRLGSNVPPDGASLVEYISAELDKQDAGKPPQAPVTAPAAPEEPASAGAPQHSTPAPSEKVAGAAASAQPPVSAADIRDETAAVEWLARGSVAQQVAAADFFSAHPTPQALRLLARRALETSPVAAHALYAVAACGGREAAQYLARAATRADLPENRELAGNLLCFRVGLEADEFIPSLLAAPHRSVRIAAIVACGRRRLAAAVGLLRRMLADSSQPERIRLEAAGALLLIDPRDAEAHAFVAAALERGGVSAYSALEVLARLPGDWPARALAGALVASDPDIALTALHGLSMRPPEEARRALAQAFGKPLAAHPRVQLAKGILNALNEPAVVTGMLASSSAEERWLACRVAGFLRLKQAEQPLAAVAAGDEHPQVRAAASEALATLSPPPAPQWAPRAVTRVYLGAGGQLEGAFILGAAGNENFYRPGDMLPDGSRLAGYREGALEITGGSGNLPVPPEAVKELPAAR